MEDVCVRLLPGLTLLHQEGAKRVDLRGLLNSFEFSLVYANDLLVLYDDKLPQVLFHQFRLVI